MKLPEFDDRGATLVEYAFLLSLLAFVCLGVIGFVGQKVEETMGRIGTEINGPTVDSSTTTTRPSTTTTTRPSTTTTTRGSRCVNGDNGDRDNNNCGNDRD